MDFEFYIDGKKCSADEFLERVDIKNNQIFNLNNKSGFDEDFDEDFDLKLSIVEDILEMMNCCRTEDTLREDLLEYFDDIFELET